MTSEEIKEYIFYNNKIEYVLKKLNCHNIKYHDNKDYFSASQPDGDNPMGVIIYNNKYLNAKSYTRKISDSEQADIFDLIMYIKKISFFDSLKYLYSLFNLNTINSYKKENNIKKSEDYFFKRIQQTLESVGLKMYKDVKEIEYEIMDEKILDDFIDIPYYGWFKEGIMPYTCKKFGILFSYRRKRIIIPMRYWYSGELLGYNSRTIISNPLLLGIKKYWITPNYKKSINLYGLWENKKSIEEKGYVVVFEAEKSVLKRDSLNDSTGVAVSGHTISEEQKRILISLNVEIIIAFDKDVDILSVKTTCEKFYNIARISYIYDNFNILKEKESPTDVSNKEYKFLFNNRYIYNRKEHEKYLRTIKKSKSNLK